jgi:hypothetical protein
MSEYKQTLERFQSYMLDLDTVMQDHVVGDDLEFRQTRLGVYHKGYSLRLIEILERCFPAILKQLGEEPFYKLCREYIAAYPSTHYSIALYGRYFSKFLAERKSTDPVLVELARFEWILEQVIDAANAPHITFDEMASSLAPEDWANLRLQTHPSLTLDEYHYEVPAFWHHLINDKDKPELTPKETAIHWLIWRYDMKAHFCSATQEQFALLQLIQAGKTFSEICAELTQTMPEEEVVNFVAGTIRQWVEEGIFCEFSAS